MIQLAKGFHCPWHVLDKLEQVKKVRKRRVPTSVNSGADTLAKEEWA